VTKPSAGQPKASDSKPEAEVEAKPEGKAEPEAEVKPESDAKAEAEPKPEVKPEPQPAAEAKPEAKPEAEPKPEAKADVAVLLNTTLGEILVAGLVKDPEDAGRLIAQGIIQTEARLAAVKAPEAAPEPEAKTPSASTPKTAE
jgi:ribonuclease E